MVCEWAKGRYLSIYVSTSIYSIHGIIHDYCIELIPIMSVDYGEGVMELGYTPVAMKKPDEIRIHFIYTIVGTDYPS
jgi:hypothetical protein